MPRSVHKLPQVFSAHPTPTSSRPKALPWRLLLVLGLGVFVYWGIFFSSLFAIDTVEIKGIAPEELSIVEQQILGENIFRLNTTSVEQMAKQTAPAIASVETVRGIPNTIRLQATLRTPSLRWHTSQGQYLLDSNGEVFAQGNTADNPDLPLVEDKSGLSYSVGQKLVTPLVVSFMVEAKQSASDSIAKPLLRGEVNETTFHIDLLFEGDVRIKTTVQRPLEEQLEAANTMLQRYPEAKHLDVRIPRWGYWK